MKSQPSIFAVLAYSGEIIMMLSVLFLLCAVNLSIGKNFNVLSNNDTERRGMSFTPLGGEFLGRYTVELCTEVFPNYTEWETIIYYHPNTTMCPKTMSLGFMHKKKMHSRNVEYTKFDSNHTNVCLSKEFDLIFSSCYTVETRFLVSPRFKSYNFNVTSAFNIDMIRENKPTVDSVNHEEKVTIIWHPGVPPTDYKVEMCEDKNSSIEESQCSAVPCTTPDWKTITCVVARPDRCVHFRLSHHAPWKSGPFHPQELAPYPYCPTGSGKPDGLSGNNWTVMSWALAVGCVAVVALLAQRLWQSRQAGQFKKLVQKTWVILTNNGRGTDAIAGQIETKTSRSILLVYARENVAGQRVIDALKTILEQNTDGQVLDIYSPLVCRLSAPAPAEWVRSMAARSDVMLLVVQTPAMHVMYGNTAREGEGGPLTVSAPLFPGRLVPRVPMFGDSLVQLVLRLLSATDLAHAYNRLYIANLSELGVELFPRVVPYRRYTLPRDAGLLAKDTAGVEPPSPTLTGEEALITALKQGTSIAPMLQGEDSLITAHREFVETVRDNPAYLMDDLLLHEPDK